MKMADRIRLKMMAVSFTGGGKHRQCSGWEWVEIIEPRTKEHMYANLTTGECVWDPPPGVKIKKTDDNQWWELFDPNTSRFYYYNATSQKTVWHRPQNCDIIPLAKLQTLKQNTEVREDGDKSVPHCKREISTQTATLQSANRTPSSVRREHVRHGSLKSPHQSQTSPHTSRRHRHYQRQDSTSSHSSSGRHDNYDLANGDRVHRRRGSQPSPQPSGNLRRESFESPRRALESPRPQRAKSVQSATLDSPVPRRQDGYLRHSQQSSGEEYGPVHVRGGSFSDPMGGFPPPDNYSMQGSFTSQLSHGRQDSYGQDMYTSTSGSETYGPAREPYRPEEYIAFSQDIVHQQGDVSPIPHSLLSKPKLRSFPRTNPAYVGVHRRDGQTAYKRINVDQQSLGYESGGQGDQGVSHQGVQASNMGEYPEMYGHYFRHERSDSDTSHSSNRGYRHDRTDSQTSHSSSRNREHSDSHSSQGSLRNMSDTHSSQGSLRNMQDSAVSVHDSLSSKGSSRTSNEHDLPLERAGSQMSHRSASVSNSEPEYANLPSTHEQDHLSSLIKEKQRSKEGQITDRDDRYIDSVRRGEEYYNRQNLPLNGQSITNQTASFHSEVAPDQGYGESDSSSVFSTSSPKSHSKPPPPPPLPIETQHASLKRRKPEAYAKVAEPVCTPVLEKSQSLQQDIAQQRPLSMVVASQSEVNMAGSPSTGSLHRQILEQSIDLDLLLKLHSDSDIENYAQQNLNRHKKGLFGKKVSLANMLAWSKDPIQKPMIRTNDKAVKKDACEIFKMIQVYMGDRKNKSPTINTALEIVTKGWSTPIIRDEIFIQLCRQTTENKKEESLQKGWELLAICLSFFPPSLKFHSYLEGYISRHTDPNCDLPNVPISHFADHCHRRLERAQATGAKRGVRKPTMDEIEQAKKSIFHPSMFGNTLDDILLMQSDKFPDRRLPWIQTILSEEVLKLNGAQTEGIFRVPGDIDEVNALKLRCDQWIPPNDCPDPHIPASLLKLWYRELYVPLIPPAFYDSCIESYANPEAAIAVINQLPEINRLVLSYLIRFLQVFAATENASVTKMDVNNLAMVMAPNCLRCESEDPKIIFENTRKEMGFIRTLIQHLDTSFMDGIV
ncbi:rho GTPase-activating protein 39-like isoform X2 [Liolophura sinensis]|uniref:rho GTPase-activating protein 39-like isoform X2 n=1 Tax=Liolophura sinensis TaxID=3198878 RepID=UPI003158FF07